MAIVLPQGLLNNTNAEYIRRFVIEEARILAVIGLHVNTFKPHTGTKTSVLFLQKYIDEEKEGIQQIKIKYEGELEEFLESLKKKYENISWNTPINEDEVPEKLNSFLKSYFETIEEIDELSFEEVKNEALERTEEEQVEKEKSLVDLINELSEIEDVLKEKQDEFEITEIERKRQLKKEIRTLQNKKKKLIREISERTLPGQISLVLSDERITEAFKKYYLDGKIMQEIDYTIFFAVNKKPVKNESGEYRYKKNPDGSFVLDEHGHPVIDHDLDEIAKAFIKFAKEQGFSF
jgi:type I restriction enzyme M protein